MGHTLDRFGHTLVRSILLSCCNVLPVCRLFQAVGEKWLSTTSLELCVRDNKKKYEGKSNIKIFTYDFLDCEKDLMELLEYVFP